MSATETWAMDIEDIVRGTIDEMGVVTAGDIEDAVSTAVDGMDIPTRDEIVSEDDVTDLVSSAIYNGYIDVTDSIDTGQLFDSYDFRSTVAEAIDDSALRDRVYDLEKWIQEREEGTPEENEGHNALVNEVKNLTERIVYMEGIINCLVDTFGDLGKALNPNEVTFTKSEPVPAFNPPQFIAEDAPYAAI